MTLCTCEHNKSEHGDFCIIHNTNECCSHCSCNKFTPQTSNHSQEINGGKTNDTLCPNTSGKVTSVTPDTSNSNFFARKLKEIEKGCGKTGVQGMLVVDCGDTILCPTCTNKREIILECQDEVRKAIDENSYTFDGTLEDGNPKMHRILLGDKDDSWIPHDVLLKKLGISSEDKIE